MSKPYNTKSLQERLNQAAPEEGGVGKAGLYRHPESGEEMHTLSDPLFGEAQSNAAEQLGFVRVRDSKPEEIKSVLDFNVATHASETDSLKGLSARVNQLEGVAEDNKRLTAEVEKYRKESLARADATGVAGHDAKEAAAAQTKLRDQAPDADPTKQVGKAPSQAPSAPLNSDRELPENSRVHVRDENRTEEEEASTETPGAVDSTSKPLDKQNATELRETAEAEGVDVEGLDTKKQFVEAIQAARDGKTEESEN